MSSEKTDNTLDLLNVLLAAQESTTENFVADSEVVVDSNQEQQSSVVPNTTTNNPTVKNYEFTEENSIPYRKTSASAIFSKFYAVVFDLNNTDSLQHYNNLLNKLYDPVSNYCLISKKVNDSNWTAFIEYYTVIFKQETNEKN